MKIALSSDHAGFGMKATVADYLRAQGHIVEDMGPFTDERVDYPDYAQIVAHSVAAGTADFGVLVCGTGMGMAIAANKIDGIRAANVTNPDFARLAREHNNANILTVSARYVDADTNLEIIDTFLSSSFGGGRHAVRVSKIRDLELNR